MCMCESWGTRSPLWGGFLAREWRDCPPVGCQSSFGRPSLAHSVACVQLDVRSVPSGLLMVAIGGPIPQTVDGGVETSAVPNAARAAGVVEISNAHDDDRRFARHADQAVTTRSSHRASPFYRAQHAGCDQQVAHQPANSRPLQTTTIQLRLKRRYPLPTSIRQQHQRARLSSSRMS